MTDTAYRELLTSADKAGGDVLDWFFACNICERRLDDGPCPDHAPRDVPGLLLAECDQGHPRMWMLDGDGYEPPCWHCVIGSMQDRIDYLQRCRHWPYRRWKLFRRIIGWAYTLGVIGGSCFSMGGGEYDHKGCTHGLRFRGKRPYVLGWPRWKWSCLLQQRHWPGVFIGMESCAKCLPCPDCGSSTSCFDGWCDNAGRAE